MILQQQVHISLLSEVSLAHGLGVALFIGCTRTNSTRCGPCTFAAFQELHFIHRRLPQIPTDV